MLVFLFQKIGNTLMDFSEHSVVYIKGYDRLIMIFSQTVERKINITLYSFPFQSASPLLETIFLLTISVASSGTSLYT